MPSYKVTIELEIDADNELAARQAATNTCLSIRASSAPTVTSVMPVNPKPRTSMSMSEELAIYPCSTIYQSALFNTSRKGNRHAQRMLATKWTDIKRSFEATPDGKDLLAKCVAHVHALKDTPYVWVEGVINM